VPTGQWPGLAYLLAAMAWWECRSFLLLAHCDRQAGARCELAKSIGNGGTASYNAVILPEVAFELGGRQAVLHGAGILMSRSIRSYIPAMRLSLDGGK